MRRAGGLLLVLVHWWMVSCVEHANRNGVGWPDRN